MKGTPSSHLSHHQGLPSAHHRVHTVTCFLNFFWPLKGAVSPHSTNGETEDGSPRNCTSLTALKGGAGHRGSSPEPLKGRPTPRPDELLIPPGPLQSRFRARRAQRYTPQGYDAGLRLRLEETRRGCGGRCGTRAVHLRHRPKADAVVRATWTGRGGRERDCGCFICSNSGKLL